MGHCVLVLGVGLLDYVLEKLLLKYTRLHVYQALNFAIRAYIVHYLIPSGFCYVEVVIFTTLVCDIGNIRCRAHSSPLSSSRVSRCHVRHIR